jgi:hypothetical protein
MRIASSRVLRVDRRSAALFRFVALFIAVAVAGCGVRLAPTYDRGIVDALTRTNEDAMTLFASVSAGGPPGTFNRRVDIYNSLQGKLESLAQMVRARGTPPPPAAGVAVLGVIGVQNPQQQANEIVQPATGDNIDAMMNIIKLMRSDDSRGKLSAPSVALLKNNFIAQMGQALKYEKFLER